MKKLIYLFILLSITLPAYAQQSCVDTSGNADQPLCGAARGDQIIDGNAGTAVKFAAINETGADSDEIIAAVAGKKIKVLGYVIACSSGTNLTFEDEDGTDVTGTMVLSNSAGTQIPPTVAPVNPMGWFETPTANKALHILKSAAVDCDGHITYVEVS